MTKRAPAPVSKGNTPVDGPASRIAVEGPQWDDAEFYSKWLSAAVEADAIWKAAADDRYFNQSERIFVNCVPPFSINACNIVRSRLNTTSNVFLICPSDWELDEEVTFVMMLEMGFFTHLHNRISNDHSAPTNLSQDYRNLVQTRGTSRSGRTSGV